MSYKETEDRAFTGNLLPDHKRVEDPFEARIEQGMLLRRDQVNKIISCDQEDVVKLDKLRDELKELDDVLFNYTKNTVRYTREHERRRLKAYRAGAQRFIHMREWFDVA